MIPVYLIGCDELPDRKKAGLEHLLAEGINPFYWRGLFGLGWGLKTVHEFEPGKTLPPGHVALNINHWTLWNHLLHTLPHDDSEAIVFEDDVLLTPDFDRSLLQVRVDLDDQFPDWDFVFLGLAEAVPGVWNKVTERVGGPTSRFCRLRDPFGTHAYLLRKRALPTLIDNMAIAERNIDQQLYGRVLSKNLLKWCAVLPSLVHQRTFDHAGVGKPEWAPSCIEPHPGEVSSQPLPDSRPKANKHEPHVHASVREIQEYVGTDFVYEKPTADFVARTLSTVNPFYCLYLGESLEYQGVNQHGKSTPLFQCGYLGTPCHIKPRTQVTGSTACETCNLRLKPDDSPRDFLPIKEHFNPSMIEWEGRLILATRDSWGHSKVSLWHLTNTQEDWMGKWSVKAVGSFASDHKEAGRLEDPRLFIAPCYKTGEPRLCCQLNMPDGYPPKFVQVGYVQFNKGLTGIEYTKVFKSPRQSLYEKNWSPLLHEDEIYWLYSMKPDFTVIGPQTYSMKNPFPWTGGAMRGGATPVPHTNPKTGKTELYVFFHGCLKRMEGNIYTMGVLTMEPRPPFRILRQSKTPIMWPGKAGPNEDVQKRYVLWPGGAVPHEGRWFFAMGVDDTYSQIRSLTFSEVEASLRSVHETDRDAVTSIRGTQITEGIPEREYKR